MSYMAVKYKRAYCEDIREYFGKFIGFWERRMEKACEHIADEHPDAHKLRMAVCDNLLAEMSAEQRLRGLPSYEKWAKRIGVHPCTVSRWREAHPEFDEACRDCDKIQVDILRDGGLSGVYAGRTATFLIKMAEERELVREGAGDGYRIEDFED